jgi:hypothetical protein
MQRLCRRVRGVIKTSSPLQTNLFFRAAKDTSGRGWVLSSNDRLLSGNEAAQYLNKATTSDLKPLIIKPAVYNPLVLTKHLDDKDSISFRRRLETLSKERMTAYGIYENFKLKHKKPPTEASCRSMLLTQPPVTTVNVEIEGKKCYPDWENRRGLPKWYYGTIARARVTNPTGVTLDDVLRKEREDGWIGNIAFPGNFVTTAEIKRMIEGA